MLLCGIGCISPVYNKIDTITIEETDKLARMPNSLVGSVARKYNIAEPLGDDPLKVSVFTCWFFLFAE